MKKEKRILSLLLLYFLFIFFYGIIIKVTIGNSILFAIKTIIPELLVLLASVSCLLLRKPRLCRWQFYGALYFSVVIAVSFIFVGYDSGSLFAFRDFFLPVFWFIIFSSFEFKEESKEFFFRNFLIVCRIYLIVGCVLGLVQMFSGWRWTSEFYTGYSFYGNDPISKVRITEYLGQVRAPGLTGNFVSFSYYGLISCIALIFGTNVSMIKKILYIILQAGILVSTLNKTAIVIYIIVLIFYLLRKARTGIRYGLTIVVGILGFIYIINSRVSNDIFYSTYARLELWRSLSRYVDWYEVFFPVKSLNYNSMAEGVISFWDNTYFYLLFSQGIIGLCWVYFSAFRVYKANVSAYLNKALLFELLFVFLIAASAFNNVTNGRSYFSVFLIFNGVFYTHNKGRIESTFEEGNRYENNSLS